MDERVARTVQPQREDARQLALLNATLNEPSSGRTRYAAAVYFYQRGMISEDCLEVYRTCSVFDHEDPKPVLAQLGLLQEHERLTSTVRSEA